MDPELRMSFVPALVEALNTSVRRTAGSIGTSSLFNINAPSPSASLGSFGDLSTIESWARTAATLPLAFLELNYADIATRNSGSFQLGDASPNDIEGASSDQPVKPSD
jgi:hypothetical protein